MLCPVNGALTLYLALDLCAFVFKDADLGFYLIFILFNWE